MPVFPNENFPEMALKTQGNAVTYHAVIFKAAMEAPTRITGSPHSAANLFGNHTHSYDGDENSCIYDSFARLEKQRKAKGRS